MLKTITNIITKLTSNSSTGVLEVTGPAAGTTRVMTVPNANFTVARTDAAQSFTGTQTMNDLLNLGVLGVSILGDNQQVATTRSFITLTGAGAARSGCFFQNGSVNGQLLYIRAATWGVTVINNPSGTQNVYFNSNAASVTFGGLSGNVYAMTLIWDSSYGSGNWFEVGRSVAP